MFVSGSVQGVGYRMFVRKNAEKLGVTGWVRNLPDSRVEVMIQGKKAAVEELLTLCKRGTFLADVKGLEIAWIAVKESFSDFSIH